MSREELLRATFVSALPGIAVSARPASARAAQLNETFLQFVVSKPPVDELRKGCEQYLEYAQQEAAAPCGLETPCLDFLRYLQGLRQSRGEASAVMNAETGHGGLRVQDELRPPSSVIGAQVGPGGLLSQIVLRDVQWYTTSDACETVARLRPQATISVDLRGAPVDTQDSDTISLEAAVELAKGLASCTGTIEALALTDMKISTESLCTVLQSLAGSPVLRRLDLSNMCSRWVTTNTLGSDRGALLSGLMRGWARLEVVILADCTLADGCISVVAALSGLGSLRDLDLTYNEMGDEAALILAKSLEGKTALERVALDGNEIGPTGMNAITTALRAMGKLGALQ